MVEKQSSSNSSLDPDVKADTVDRHGDAPKTWYPFGAHVSIQ